MKEPARAVGGGRTKEEATLDPQRPLAELRGEGRFLAIYEIGRHLIEQKEPREVIGTIQHAIVEHLKPDHACVLTVAGDGSCLPLATHNLDLRGPFQSWPLSHTVLMRARESGLAVLALDSLAGLEDAESVQRLRIRSVMCVPLGRKPVRGLIYVDNRVLRPFTRDDLDFLTAVSLYASLVLERAEEYLRASEALRLSDERRGVLNEELLRHEIVGRSPRLLEAYDTLRRFARSGARVLLRGETGTGKELFARAYAAHSGRAAQAYVPVPIPALAPGLIESELFGHVRGAFTEATRDKKGRLELAEGGVLFLDEVGDIDPSLQPKLLRFLDSGELFRVGDTEARRIDTLVVSATNRPLEREIESGHFRADLLARLGHEVRLPPLRERPDDIPLLVDSFLARAATGSGRKTFSADAIAALQRHTWPLNVRELQQVVERACCLVDKTVIDVEDLAVPPGLGARQPARPGLRPLREVVAQAERAHIAHVLEATGGNKRRAIEVLEVSPETFYRRLGDLGFRKREP
jgi:DNA-binding NtrC family response regulator